jgi:hypothetical protein
MKTNRHPIPTTPLLLACFLCLLPALTRAETPVEAWVQRYNGPGNNEDEARAVAADTNGNVFVTGTSYGAGSDSDFATIAYSSAGAPLWTNRYNGPENYDDEAMALGLDCAGNVFVTGYSLSSASGYDYVTIKYSNAGLPLWTNRFNGPMNDDDMPTALVVDGAGDVYVTGTSIGSGYEDYATIKYSSAGAPVWTNRYNGTGNRPDQATGIALGGSNVFVTGNSTGSGGGRDFATVKYEIVSGTP